MRLYRVYINHNGIRANTSDSELRHTAVELFLAIAHSYEDADGALVVATRNGSCPWIDFSLRGNIIRVGVEKA